MKAELLAAVALAVFFLVFLAVNQSGEHSWEGADGQAEGVIYELTNGTYQPWMRAIWEPPSGEVESLFFSLQAAIGGLIIGYFLGYFRRGRLDRAP